MKRSSRSILAVSLTLGLALAGCDGGSGSLKEGIPSDVVPGVTPAPVAKTGMGMMGPGAIKKERSAEKTGGAAPTAP